MFTPLFPFKVYYFQYTFAIYSSVFPFSLTTVALFFLTIMICSEQTLYFKVSYDGLSLSPSLLIGISSLFHNWGPSLIFIIFLFFIVAVSRGFVIVGSISIFYIFILVSLWLLFQKIFSSATVLSRYTLHLCTQTLLLFSFVRSRVAFSNFVFHHLLCNSDVRSRSVIVSVIVSN